MKITLSGHYTKETNKHHPETAMPYTSGYTEVPVKVMIEIKDGFCRFNFWDYDSIFDGDNPKDKRIGHKGKFTANADDMKATEHKDMSGGIWHNIVVCGEYVSWAGRGCELRISQAQYNTKLTDAWAVWPRKRFNYRGCPVDMKNGESTLLHLDAKSQIKFDELWESLRNE
jgi:hypothetical protein